MIDLPRSYWKEMRERLDRASFDPDTRIHANGIRTVDRSDPQIPKPTEYVRV